MLIQFLIAAMSLTATWLSTHHLDSRRRWACFFGLGVQPLWMIATWSHDQWGMFGLCFVYGAIWLNNGRRYWGARALRTLWARWRLRHVPDAECICGGDPLTCSLFICGKTTNKATLVAQYAEDRNK